MWKKSPLAPKLNKEKLSETKAAPAWGEDLRRTAGSGGPEAEDTCPAFRACCLDPRERKAMGYLLAVMSISDIQRCLCPQLDTEEEDNLDPKGKMNRVIIIPQQGFLVDQ